MAKLMGKLLVALVIISAFIVYFPYPELDNVEANVAKQFQSQDVHVDVKYPGGLYKVSVDGHPTIVICSLDLFKNAKCQITSDVEE